MAVNVPSGIITIASGAGVPRLTVNALPVALFGASGDVAISHYSGVLNVNISGGSVAANISGNVVVIASGFGAISGVQVIISGGAGSPNISGGVTVSGGVTISGNISSLSGGLVQIQDRISGLGVGASSGADGRLGLNVFVVSGSVTGGGGSIAAYQSGTLVSISGGVAGLSGLIVIPRGSEVFTQTTITATTLTNHLSRSGAGVIEFIGVEDLDASANNDSMSLSVNGGLLISGTRNAGALELVWVDDSIEEQTWGSITLTLANFTDGGKIRYNGSIQIQFASHSAPTAGIRIRTKEERFF
mgnify:CR=1 FL=1